SSSPCDPRPPGPGTPRGRRPGPDRSGVDPRRGGRESPATRAPLSGRRRLPLRRVPKAFLVRRGNPLREGRRRSPPRGPTHLPASRIGATPQDLHGRVTSEGPQESQQNPTEVVDGRRPSHVRSSNEAHVNGSCGCGGYRKKGLQDQGDTARGPDVERDPAWGQLPRSELDR